MFVRLEVPPIVHPMYCSVETTELVQSHPIFMISSISEEQGLALLAVLAVMMADGRIVRPFLLLGSRARRLWFVKPTRR